MIVNIDPDYTTASGRPLSQARTWRFVRFASVEPGTASLLGSHERAVSDSPAEIDQPGQRQWASIVDASNAPAGMLVPRPPRSNAGPNPSSWDRLSR